MGVLWTWEYGSEDRDCGGKGRGAVTMISSSMPKVSGRFGLPVVAESKVMLSIFAGWSPKFASLLQLFEETGVVDIATRAVWR